MKKYTADFETCVWLENETYVWAWAVSEIGNDDNIIIDNNIDSFIEFCKKEKNATFYFHNLKFDGEFIIYWALTHGFTHVEKIEDIKENTFTTLISDMGQFYSITLYYSKGNKKVHKTTFYDSLKIIPFSVDQVAKSFNLEISKLTLDYNTPRSRNHILTPEEKDYITNDVVIVSKALNVLMNENLRKMTAGSNALSDYKNIINKFRFKHYFPELTAEADSDIRKAYKGGFTYLNPYYKNKIVGNGVVLDVNSLYPSIMRSKRLLPFGEGKFFEGKYIPDRVYPLYIQSFTCSFKIKKNKIPTIQLKDKHYKWYFMPNEYIESSKGEIVNLCLTNIDMKLFFTHYEVKVTEWLDGYMFKGSKLLFAKWIDKYYKLKEQATIEHNEGKRTIAKLMQNSLYGKFGLNPLIKSKMPVLKDNIVKYENIKYLCTDEKGVPLQNELGEYIETDKKYREPIYIPIATFVTSHARYKTISTAQKIHIESIKKTGVSRWLYCDTDSLHLEGFEIPKDIEVHDTKLGAWALENCFERGKFIQAKRYVEENLIFKDGVDITKPIINQCLKNGYGEPISKLSVTCAGLQKQFHKDVTFENFKIGMRYRKFIPKTVEGGVILEETEFTLK